MKHPEITNPIKRSKESCKTVSEVFRKRPWVIDLYETTKNSRLDEMGYDMFIKVERSFLESFVLGGERGTLAVQIKSGDRSVKRFWHDYREKGRFFNNIEGDHQFILCGMDEHEQVLADIVGQLVVHASMFEVSEKAVLKYLESIGDGVAVKMYLRDKARLVFLWYGTRLPPS